MIKIILLIMTTYSVHLNWDKASKIFLIRNSLCVFFIVCEG